ncbi:MAG TPA: sigma-54 dependent transcriptional regulator [Anaeromyxobacteraceae bacterium]|nr:sigma-54 dependent transcriptional regulator [Anaeromyxobacteraceae bacterium]
MTAEASVVVGEGQGLRAVMELVVRAAPADVPILITGETGSGKEVVARAIHERSARAAGPIIRVNCGAIPTELVDSELFGHEKGSFTGAVAARKGWFERADSGTLFLDEIGELTLAAQVRLLRVLQDGTFERVGGQKTLSVNVRIVAATHRDLSTMVAAGQFRRDLWYRLSVFPIHLPPLRERVEDIGPFATHFAAQAGTRLFGAPVVPTEEDIALLRAQTWPGNVRELAAVIERAALLGEGRALAVAAALEAAPQLEDGPAAPMLIPLLGPPPSPDRPVDGATIKPLEAVMIEHIERALANVGGRIEGPSGAAELLGINPHTLRARMRKLGIDWARFRARAGLRSLGG